VDADATDADADHATEDAAAHLQFGDHHQDVAVMSQAHVAAVTEDSFH